MFTFIKTREEVGPLGSARCDCELAVFAVLEAERRHKDLTLVANVHGAPPLGTLELDEAIVAITHIHKSNTRVRVEQLLRAEFRGRLNEGPVRRHDVATAEVAIGHAATMGPNCLVEPDPHI
jgi:hypothetical protein